MLSGGVEQNLLGLDVTGYTIDDQYTRISRELYTDHVGSLT